MRDVREVSKIVENLFWSILLNYCNKALTSEASAIEKKQLSQGQLDLV